MIKPILFNTEMVQANLDGRKKATRRVVKPQPDIDGLVRFDDTRFVDTDARLYKPPYQPGDILYVRETWQFIPCIDCLENAFGTCNFNPVTYEDKDSISDGCFVYRADYHQKERIVWHPSIHMPKEAARLFLRVTDVRVERLQDIDDAGVAAEGLQIGDPFDELWDSTIKPADREKYGWNANPWVWVIEYERCEKPEEV